MKTFLLIITTLVITSFASSSKYEQQMLKHIEGLNKAESPQDFQMLTNAFDRIAKAEKDKWEPYYYGAYSTLLWSYRISEVSEKDKLIDQALEKINTAAKLAPQESEIVALEGFAHMTRVTIDPASRGAQYSGLALQTYGKAMAMNPENPRAMLLMGQMQYGTAQFFGSDTSEACGLIKKSISAFETYENNNPLAPAWGEGQAKAALGRCQ
ncbi:MAG: hypothetical protein AAGG59_19020 [Bacteroidota bacterium]